MKLNLKSDARKVRNYIKTRIKDYPIYENIGPGEDDALISRITVGFYAEQGGYMNLVFDTRPAAEYDGEWTRYIDNETNTLPFPKWRAVYEAIWAGKTISVTKHDGTSCTLEDSSGDVAVNEVFGDMLLFVMSELHENGTLAKLPLAPDVIVAVEEFDGRYCA